MIDGAEHLEPEPKFAFRHARMMDHINNGCLVVVASEGHPCEHLADLVVDMKRRCILSR